MTGHEIIPEADLPWLDSAEAIGQLPLHTESVLVRQLDDAKAVALSRLPNLRTLVQDGQPRITDRGLEALGRITTLERLDLEWSSRITDAGLLHLGTLSRLAFLDLGFCDQITNVGVRALRARLPSCSIYGVAA